MTKAPEPTIGGQSLLIDRQDSGTSIHVERGLFLLKMTGSYREAAEYMAFRKVPFKIAHRTLLMPNQRRQTQMHMH